MTGEADPKAPAPGQKLDDLLVALQKTMSRVSARSSEVPSENARALITGQVLFDLKTRVELDQDHVRLAPQGGVEISLSGAIQSDVRPVDLDDAERPSTTAPRREAVARATAGKPVEAVTPARAKAATSPSKKRKVPRGG